tara:strand:- start:148 stop:390 length:243 start_codon:yes stop_codon:yes gene_type:complete
MVGYKAAKAAGKTSVAKTGDKYFLIRKRYDPDTGVELDDLTEECYINNISQTITNIETRITALTSEKEDYEQLKTDLEAL